MYSLLSALIGALTAIMIYVNGDLARFIGNYASSSFIHFSGLLIVSLILLLLRAKSPCQKSIPPALFSGGLLGFLTVVFANSGFQGLGVSLTLALGLLGQTIAALIIDQYGLMGAAVARFNRQKLGSVALIGLGIALMAFF